MIHRRHGGWLRSLNQRLHGGKVEGVRLLHGADLQPAAVVLYPQADIAVAGVIPGQYGGIVIPVAAAVQVDTAVKRARIGALRSQVGAVGRRAYAVAARVAGIEVLQLVIIVGIPVVVIILGKIPFRRIDAAACPLDHIAALITAHQGAVVVDNEELVTLGGVVPFTGIDDHILAVRHFRIVGQVDLLRAVHGEIIVRQQGGFCDKVQPGVIVAAV